MQAEKRWIPELDGLRLLMILMVSWYHIWQQSWLTPMLGNYSLDYLMRSGYVWVDGTVLMSAFLLYRPYAAVRLRRAPMPDVRDFYRRRARKILPGYYGILCLTFFCICLPYGLYSSPQYLVKDVATHLTFLFPFFRDTYLITPLGAACWTLAIEVQAYALFPWVARASLKHPGRTAGVLLGFCLGFRIWCIWSLNDFNMVVNQLINFGDVYVLGCLLAVAFEKLRLREERDGKLFRGSAWAATAVFFLAFFGLLRMLRIQAASSVYTMEEGIAGAISRFIGMAEPSSNYPVIQRNQMLYRPVYGILFGTLMVSAPFAVRPLRKLLGNRGAHFLAGISMNYYLSHQNVIVHMRRIGFPASEYEHPNQAGDGPWQVQYTWWAFGLSLLAAIAVTYLVEKPIQLALDRRRQKRQSAGAEGSEGKTGTEKASPAGEA